MTPAAPDLFDQPAPGLRMVTPRFRGPLWEYIKDIPMRDGYSNEGQPFDIETAHYLKPVFMAIQDPLIPVVGALAAVQTLKTFSCIDVPVPYFIEHDPADTNVYFGIDNAARDHSRSRVMRFWRSIPGVDAKFLAAEANNRFDVTTQSIHLDGMTLRIWPLNEASVARMTLRRVMVSDAYLTGKSGMLNQAIRRTTAHEHDRKIIVESQGGEVGDDMDVFFRSTSMGRLHVVCPLCGNAQEFSFSHERGSDFIAKPTKDIPSLDHVAWIEKNTPLLKADDRKFAGFKRGLEETVKNKDGTLNEAEIAKQTTYECFHCGGTWFDTPETRLALDKSSFYVASNPNAVPGRVGFSWPAWAGQRLKWGGEQVMLGYLRAKQRLELFGNREDLKQWYQKSAAVPWDQKLVSQLRAARRDVYEVSAAKHDAWRLFMVVDNQLDLMTQWVVVWACKKNGALRQIWRGALHGLEQVRWKQMEYLDDAKRPLIKDQWVFLDGRYRPEQICRHIIENRYGHWTNYNGERTWMGWTILQGSQYEYFPHADEKDVTKKFVVGDVSLRPYSIDDLHVTIEFYPFSATACGQRFEIDRDGKGSEMLFLPRQEGEPPDDHDLSHQSQIFSNVLVESKSFAPRAAKMRYVPQPPSRPDHYFHIGRMTEAVKAIWHVDGIYAETTEEKA